MSEPSPAAGDQTGKSVGRGRGRPRDVPTAAAVPGTEPTSTSTATTGRARGRSAVLGASGQQPESSRPGGDGQPPQQQQTTAAPPAAARARGRGRQAAASAGMQPGATTGESTAEKLTPERLVQLTIRECNTGHLRVMSRPESGGYGTVGRPIALEANFFRLKLAGTLVVQRYHVHFEKSTARRPLHTLKREDNRRLFWGMVEKHPDVFPRHDEILYDDRACCYSLSVLPNFGGNLMKTFVFRLSLDDVGREYEWTMKLDHTGQHEVNLQHLAMDMTPVQVLDLLVTQSIRFDAAANAQTAPWFSYGRAIYRHQGDQDRETVSLGSGREMWPGLHSAAKVGEGGQLFLNADVAHTVFYRQCSLIDMFCELYNGKMHDRRYRVSAADVRDDMLWLEWYNMLLNAELRGLRLSSHYRGGKRTYRYYKIGLPANQLMIDFPDGSRLSVQEYLAKQYGVQLRFPNLPCVMCGSENKHDCAVPFELLAIAEKPQKVPFKLITGEQTAQLIKKSASQKPRMRRQRIIDLLRDAQTQQPVDFMGAYGVTVETEPVQFDGRVIPAPNVQYASGSNTKVDRGEWRMAQQDRFHRPAQIANWGAIAYNMNQDRLPMCELVWAICQTNFLIDQAHFSQFVRDVRTWMENYGVQLPADCLHTECREKAHLPEQMQKYHERWTTGEAGQREGVNFILIIFPAKDNHDEYKLAKRTGDVDLGVITQCVRFQTVEGALRRPFPNSTAVNICLKINMKNGGINNAVEVDHVFKQLTEQQSTLFLGVDVTHPAPGDTRGRSIAAIVGNVDRLGAKYAASTKVQRTGLEKVVYMKHEVQERIHGFYKGTGCKPTRIIVYRDGISDSQYEQILREEVGTIRAAIEGIDKEHAKKVTITYIVVRKRHHTRFWPLNEKDAGAGGNVPPGTVADRTISSPNVYDFYLCSHAGPLGTSRPAHYVVLYDESGMQDADGIQLLSYKLCHVYGRCNKSVSLPAPVYWADRAATRARLHYEAEFGSDDYPLHQGTSGRTQGSLGSDEQIQHKVNVHGNVRAMAYFA